MVVNYWSDLLELEVIVNHEKADELDVFLEDVVGIHKGLILNSDVLIKLCNNFL